MIKYILILLALCITTSCDWREEQAKNILSKAKLREDIFNAIMKDSIYLSEFISKVTKDNQANAMLKKNVPLAKMLCTSSTVDSLLHSDAEVNRLLAIKLVHRMEEDTVSCNLMCGMVMENPVLRRHLKENICPDVLHQSTPLK